jgi:hypothetical protein
MKKYLKFLFAATCAVALHSCSYTYMARYDVGLSAVIQPQGTEEGQITAIMSRDSTMRYTYENSDILASWVVTHRTLALQLLNRGASTIKMNTDDMCFVDYKGAASRVMNAELPFAQRNAIQPTITVPAGSYTNVAVIPTCNIQGGQVVNLVPSYYKDYDAMMNGGPKYVGKTLQMLVPLHIGGQLKEYLFIFTLDKFLPEAQFELPSPVRY